MNDILNQDMINALDALDINPADREILRTILSNEIGNKDREWDDDAIDLIVKQLEVDRANQ